MIPYKRKVSIKKRLITGLCTLATVFSLTAPILFPVKIGEFGIELFWILAGIYIFLETVTVVVLLKIRKITPYELTANLISLFQFTVWLIRSSLALVFYVVGWVLRTALAAVFGCVGIVLSLLALPVTLPVEAIQKHRAEKEAKAADAA